MFGILPGCRVVPVEVVIGIRLLRHQFENIRPQGVGEGPSHRFGVAAGREIDYQCTACCLQLARLFPCSGGR